MNEVVRGRLFNIPNQQLDIWISIVLQLLLPLIRIMDVYPKEESTRIYYGVFIDQESISDTNPIEDVSTV